MASNPRPGVVSRGIVVIRTARQARCQEALFVKQPPYARGDHEDQRQQAPPRTE
jgi:hypothetical protein